MLTLKISVFLALCFAFPHPVQAPVAEPYKDPQSDNDGIKDIEEPYITWCGNSPIELDHLAGDAKQISYQDQKIKWNTAAFCRPCFPCLVYIQRPGNAKTYNHQKFKKIRHIWFLPFVFLMNHFSRKSLTQRTYSSSNSMVKRCPPGNSVYSACGIFSAISLPKPSGLIRSYVPETTNV